MTKREILRALFKSAVDDWNQRNYGIMDSPDFTLFDRKLADLFVEKFDDDDLDRWLVQLLNNEDAYLDIGTFNGDEYTIGIRS